MLEVGLGVAIFTGLVLVLVLVIVATRSQLVPTGEVEIRINSERSIRAPVGGKLSTALAEAGIVLPAACGGRGTCGLCRIETDTCAGDYLSVEAARLTRRELARGVRLACQVELKQDLAVRVPPEILGVREIVCTVRSNRCVSTFIKELVLELPPGEEMDTRAGTFVQLTCPPFQISFADFDIDARFRREWDRLDLWHYRASAAKPTTRAYSLANRPGEKGVLILNVRIATPPPGAAPSVPPGIVSSWIFARRAEDRVTVSGPFGQFLATANDREMVFVGGGAGMAPMRAHIFDQLEHLRSGRTITFWYGARSRQEIFYQEEFDRLQAEHDNFRWTVALSEPKPTDDWQGPTGFIHEVLYQEYLRDHPAPEECEYYLCGPPMMIKATQRMLDELGVDPADVRFDDFG